MEFVIILALFLVAIIGLVIGYNAGARRTQEVLIAAITLAFDKQDEELSYSELVAKMTGLIKSDEGARMIRLLLRAARTEEQKNQPAE